MFGNNSREGWKCRTGNTAVKYSTGDFTLLGYVCSFALFHAFAALGNKKTHFNCLLFLLSNTSGVLFKKTAVKCGFKFVILSSMQLVHITERKTLGTRIVQSG